MALDFAPDFLVWPVLTWESQAVQYPKRKGSGVDHFLGSTKYGDVDCLLFYQDGELVGILNYYAFDVPNESRISLLMGAPEWLERKGNVNIFVHPDHRREGIATALLNLAELRFGPINYAQQKYSEEGWAFIQRYAERMDDEARD